jgi:hypothetical protein
MLTPPVAEHGVLFKNPAHGLRLDHLKVCAIFAVKVGQSRSKEKSPEHLTIFDRVTGALGETAQAGA